MTATPPDTLPTEWDWANSPTGRGLWPAITAAAQTLDDYTLDALANFPSGADDLTDRDADALSTLLREALPGLVWRYDGTNLTVGVHYPTATGEDLAVTDEPHPLRSAAAVPGDATGWAAVFGYALRTYARFDRVCHGIGRPSITTPHPRWDVTPRGTIPTPKPRWLAMASCSCGKKCPPEFYLSTEAQFAVDNIYEFMQNHIGYVDVVDCDDPDPEDLYKAFLAVNHPDVWVMVAPVFGVPARIADHASLELFRDQGPTLIVSTDTVRREPFDVATVAASSDAEIGLAVADLLDMWPGLQKSVEGRLRRLRDAVWEERNTRRD